ncbi:short-chain dehydrogenase [Sporosarcina globispora]|uniref:Short-chain dehydrogenase n=1 Tax=Sporosarcina globispora TaxID=1459 RepID=A0A0M0G937_SPOGL|nr:(S)-benzoin forming benzil reductase [Sporosarcina globispora]KON86420.1 short-chain dehydrogenase [Sporosarcina globispora]
MKLAIITGASKGLGASIAKRMVIEGTGIISVSRTENPEMAKLAAENQVFYAQYFCNLSSPGELETAFKEITALLQEKQPETLYVFNNAGIIGPIGTAGNLDHTALIQNAHVNLIAPIMISNILLREVSSEMTIVNITSGAAERPIQGWSAYCSTKAGINMFTQTAALEQQTAGSSHKIIAFSPGVMDTDMQGTIRSSAKEAFHDLEKFQAYKEKGMLRETETVANALVDLLLQKEIKSGKVYYVNDLI